MEDSYELTVRPEGRILAPASVRSAAGIEPGTRVVVRLEGDRVVLISRVMR
jgi:AbrB family looped-hinge helix DNA binding protein